LDGNFADYYNDPIPGKLIAFAAETVHSVEQQICHVLTSVNASVSHQNCNLG
jgi:hypothetical protein